VATRDSSKIPGTGNIGEETINGIIIGRKITDINTNFELFFIVELEIGEYF
jgi:hypothetical protein